MNIYIPLHIIIIGNVLSHIYSLPLDIYVSVCVYTVFFAPSSETRLHTSACMS